MVPMHAEKRKEAFHEPLFRSAGCQPAVSPIANRRGVGTSNSQRVGNTPCQKHRGRINALSTTGPRRLAAGDTADTAVCATAKAQLVQYWFMAAMRVHAQQ